MGRWGTKSESRGPGESEGGARAKGGTAPGGPRRHLSEGETRKLAETRRKRTPERGKRRPKALPLSYPPQDASLGSEFNLCLPRTFPRATPAQLQRPVSARTSAARRPPAAPPRGWRPAVPPRAALRAGPQGLPATGRRQAECPFAVEGRRGAGWSLGTHRAAVSPRDPPQPASRSPGSCRVPAQGRWPPPPPPRRPRDPLSQARLPEDHPAEDEGLLTPH